MHSIGSWWIVASTQDTIVMWLASLAVHCRSCPMTGCAPCVVPRRISSSSRIRRSPVSPRTRVSRFLKGSKTVVANARTWRQAATFWPHHPGPLVIVIPFSHTGKATLSTNSQITVTENCGTPMPHFPVNRLPRKNLLHVYPTCNWWLAFSGYLYSFQYCSSAGYGFGGNTLTSGQKSGLIYGALAVFFFIFLSGKWALLPTTKKAVFAIDYSSNPVAEDPFDWLNRPTS